MASRPNMKESKNRFAHVFADPNLGSPIRLPPTPIREKHAKNTPIVAQKSTPRTAASAVFTHDQKNGGKRDAESLFSPRPLRSAAGKADTPIPQKSNGADEFSQKETLAVFKMKKFIQQFSYWERRQQEKANRFSTGFKSTATPSGKGLLYPKLDDLFTAVKAFIKSGSLKLALRSLKVINRLPECPLKSEAISRADYWVQLAQVSSLLGDRAGTIAAYKEGKRNQCKPSDVLEKAIRDSLTQWKNDHLQEENKVEIRTNLEISFDEANESLKYKNEDGVSASDEENPKSLKTKSLATPVMEQLRSKMEGIDSKKFAMDEKECTPILNKLMSKLGSLKIDGDVSAQDSSESSHVDRLNAESTSSLSMNSGVRRNTSKSSSLAPLDSDDHAICNVDDSSKQIQSTPPNAGVDESVHIVDSEIDSIAQEISNIPLGNSITQGSKKAEHRRENSTAKSSISPVIVEKYKSKGQTKKLPNQVKPPVPGFSSPPKNQNSSGGSVIVMEPIRLRAAKADMIGSDMILSPVRRSRRVNQDELRAAGSSDNDYKQVLDQTQYSYSPNPALQSSLRPSVRIPVFTIPEVPVSRRPKKDDTPAKKRTKQNTPVQPAKESDSDARTPPKRSLKHSQESLENQTCNVEIGSIEVSPKVKGTPNKTTATEVNLTPRRSERLKARSTTKNA